MNAYYYSSWFNDETKINNLKKEQLSVRIQKKDLDKRERLLRNKIWINKLKKELEEERRGWDIEDIAELEIEATNKILKALYEYPYQLSNENYWYQPNKVLEFKETYCVWFSLLWSSYLSELWIKHNWLQIHRHSALEVIIWWKKYYFDATGTDEILPIKYWKKAWKYDEITIQTKYWKTFYASAWDPEKILFAQIYNNTWNTESKDGNYNNALQMYSKWIALDPNSADLYSNLWNILKKMWRWEDAIKMANIAIKINPKAANYYKSKWIILYDLWRYQEAYDNLNNSLLKNDLKAEINNKKWDCLYELWKYKEALEEYDIAIMLDPDNYWYHRNRWDCLLKLWKHDEAIKSYYNSLVVEPKYLKAYKGLSTALRRAWRNKASMLSRNLNSKWSRNMSLLIWKRNWYSKQKSNVEKMYVRESTTIDYYLKQKDFAWLRDYIMTL